MHIWLIIHVCLGRKLTNWWDCTILFWISWNSKFTGVNLIDSFCRAPHLRIFLVLRRRLRRRLSRRNEYMAVKDQLLYILMSKLGTSISRNFPFISTGRNSGGYISFSTTLFWQYYSLVQFSTLFAYSTQFAQFHRQHFRYSTNIMIHL